MKNPPGAELVAEAIADLRQAIADLEEDADRQGHDPDVWDAAGDLAQGAAGLLSDASRLGRETL